MIEPGEKFSFLTPQRRNTKEQLFNRTTTGSKFGLFSNHNSPYHRLHENKINTQDEHKINKDSFERLRWLQSRVAQLKVYITQTPKISRRAINQIFGWNNKIKEISQQRKLVKEIGVKVQMLLKENNQLRSMTKDVHDQKSNLLVKELGSELTRKCAGEYSARNHHNAQIQDNQDIVQYMSKKKKQLNKLIVYEPVKRSPPKNSEVIEGKSGQGSANNFQKQKQFALNEELLSIQKAKNLKKYFTLYINTIIEENDDKFAAAQKYIKTLEDRINNLQTIQGKIDHLKFEKQVKLQQTGRKSKLVSIAGPNIKGDAQSNVEVTQSILQQSMAKKQSTPINYFASKQKLQKIANNELESQFVSLRQQNNMLQIQLQSMRQKYEKEIENHIRDTYNHEELILDIQRYQLQNTYLKDKLGQNKGSSIKKR